MEVVTLSALSDNYMYLIIEKASKICAAVDPVEPNKILSAVEKHGARLTSVLTTHHHSDHAGGNAELVAEWKTRTGKDLVVYGGDKRIDAMTDSVKNEQKFTIGNGLNVICYSTPCHTSGHVCYHVTHADDCNGSVFTGDTLFLGGCGRFFEGTAEQMHSALLGTLGRLPAEAKVYCGHEYTLKNLEFALTVEPKNELLKKRIETVRKLREAGTPTVPGTIREELLTNPFMRVTAEDVLSHAKTKDPVEAMRIIRAEKDNF